MAWSCTSSLTGWIMFREGIWNVATSAHKIRFYVRSWAKGKLDLVFIPTSILFILCVIYNRKLSEEILIMIEKERILKCTPTFSLSLCLSRRSLSQIKIICAIQKNYPRKNKLSEMLGTKEIHQQASFSGYSDGACTFLLIKDFVVFPTLFQQWILHLANLFSVWWFSLFFSYIIRKHTEHFTWGFFYKPHVGFVCVAAVERT